MDLELKNKTVFISGSSRGIGLGIARGFLSEGAQVVINARDALVLEEAYQQLKNTFPQANILKMNHDLTSESDILNALEASADYFGGIDCVIANIGSGKEPAGVINSDVLFKSFEVNLASSVLLLQHAIPYLKKSSMGNFIAIGSIAGSEALNAPLSYSIFKSGLVAAVKKSARTLGSFGVRVNLIAPGNIYFPEGTWDKKLKQDPEGVKSYIASEVPLNQFGTVEDIANTALFLASPKAKFITGSVVTVDGGQTRSF